MRTSDLDLATMLRLLGDLTAAYGKPFGAAAERQAKVYHEALRDCSCDEVEAAVALACKTLEHFPWPAKLRGVVMEQRGKRRSLLGTDHRDLDTCEQCRTPYQWRRLPHWVQYAESRLCDCLWRVELRGYATDDDLAEMSIHDDPFAADELRRRARRSA